MDFNQFIDWADKQIQNVVNKDKDKVFSTNERKNYLLPLFLSYNNLKETKRLVRLTWWLMLATWALAIATIILSLQGR